MINGNGPWLWWVCSTYQTDPLCPSPVFCWNTSMNPPRWSVIPLTVVFLMIDYTFCLWDWNNHAKLGVLLKLFSTRELPVSVNCMFIQMLILELVLWLDFPCTSVLAITHAFNIKTFSVGSGQERKADFVWLYELWKMPPDQQQWIITFGTNININLAPTCSFM